MSVKKRHLHVIMGDSYGKKKMDFIEVILEARRSFYRETGKRLLEFKYTPHSTEKGFDIITIEIEGDLGHGIIGMPHSFDYDIENSIEG